MLTPANLTSLQEAAKEAWKEELVVSPTMLRYCYWFDEKRECQIDHCKRKKECEELKKIRQGEEL